MTISTIAATTAAKAATTWLGSQLAQWIKDRKSSAEEAKLWNKITTIVLKQTKTTAERYSKITTVAFPREPVSLDSIYIPLTLEDSLSGQEALIDEFPKKLLQKNRKILIVDVAGMGKSTLSRIIFLKSLEERIHLPILIDLRRIDGSEDIENALAKQFGLTSKHIELFSEFLSTQPLLFLFDGFDEVNQSKKNQVARTIRHFVDRSESGRFIMTSRPELPFSDYADFTSFHIKELTKEQAHQLVRSYGKAYGISDSAKALLEELHAKHDGPVASFLKNPLLTSLLFRAFEYKSVIPVKRGVFYRQVFDALYEAHDLSKETGYVREKKTGLHHDDFHRVLRAIAKLYRQKRVIEVDLDTFRSMAKDVSKTLCPDLAFPPEALLHDAVHAVPLFIQDGNLIRWAHKSLLDYFLCEFLLRDYSESKEEALQRASAGIHCKVNENFLVLVHEADPILFAKSITLPAIDRLIERQQLISKKIPSDIPENITEDISTFFMSFEAIYSPEEDGGTEAWVQSSPDLLFSTEDFFPQLLYSFGPEKGSIGIYMHEAAAALNVPMMAGTIPRATGYSMMREYPKSNGSADFPRPEGVTPFIGSRTSKKDWASAEDDFASLMGLLQGSEIMLPTREILLQAKQNLHKLVEVSIKARSNEIF